MKNKTLSMILATLAMSALVACGKSGGGGGAAAVTPNYGFLPQNCPTCFTGTPGLLLSNVQSRTGYGGLQFILNIFGDTTKQPIYPYVWGDPRVVIGYSGSVQMQGQLNVSGSYNYCNGRMLPGTYTVTTFDQGTMGYDAVTSGRIAMYGRDLVIQAIGPGSIVFRLSTAEMYNATDGLNMYSPNNRIGMNMIVESVNGISCGDLMNTL